MTSQEPHFQAHELVYCANCLLPYDLQVNITQIKLPQDAATRSWYLTNCGHALCSQCLFPNGIPPQIEQSRYPCPKCNHSASVVVLGAEIPPEILPYFRSITEMSEEVLGAIKFQHQNLLHLVDHLRSQLAHCTSLLQNCREELEIRKQDKTRIQELEKTVSDLTKRLQQREEMPPPSLPQHTRPIPLGSTLVSPGAPANFRSEMASRPITGPSRLARPKTSFPIPPAPQQDTLTLDNIGQEQYGLPELKPSISSTGHNFLEGTNIQSIPQHSRQFTQTPQVTSYTQGSPSTLAPYLVQRNTTANVARNISNGHSSPAFQQSGQLERPATSVIRSSRDIILPRTPRTPYAGTRLASRAVSSRGKGVSPMRPSETGSNSGFVSRLNEHGRRQ